MSNIIKGSELPHEIYLEWKVRFPDYTFADEFHIKPSYNWYENCLVPFQSTENDGKYYEYKGITYLNFDFLGRFVMIRNLETSARLLVYYDDIDYENFIVPVVKGAKMLYNQEPKRLFSGWYNYA